jgi:hypothetical protein
VDEGPPIDIAALVHRDLLAGRYLTSRRGRYRCRGVDDADRPLWQRSLQLRP